MPVNLEAPKKLLPIKGIKIVSKAAGIRYKDRKDLVVMEIAEGSNTAAVFTQNAFCAAPVHLCRRHLRQYSPRYLLINAGNANAGTGAEGMKNALTTCKLMAHEAMCLPEEILPFSTGVIGEQLDVSKFADVMTDIVDDLETDAWLDAANAILTTDIVAKGISKQININGEVVTITGIAKGSGMIKPNMATMLSYVATDAAVEKTLLQDLLNQGVADSFNSITVDSDTSTNDALVLVATGQSTAEITEDNLTEFQTALNEVLTYLAHAIVRDGEGATKFITIEVQEAKTREEAREVGYTVAHSPLVKTALFASDPNWGRILAAVGRSNVEGLNVERISLWLGDTLLLKDGMPADTYTEEQGQAEMDKEDITIRIQLGRGEVSTKIWTTDLSYEYVKINADYRS